MSGSGTDKTKSGVTLAGPVVILVEPQLGENIGMARGAVGNFGLTRLRIVNQRDGWPNVHARRAASGADHVLDHVELFDTVEQAVADCTLLFATTAPALPPRPPPRADQVLAHVELFDTVEQAVPDCTWLFATTARAHDQAKPVVAPEAAAREIAAEITGGGT